MHVETAVFQSKRHAIIFLDEDELKSWIRRFKQGRHLGVTQYPKKEYLAGWLDKFNAALKEIEDSNINHSDDRFNQ